MYKVAQCWDDGVESDIFVADICRKYNAKATFNICPGTCDKHTRKYRRTLNNFKIMKLSLDEMPSVYEGFEVASHTMTHPNSLEISPEAFRKEASDARKWIEDIWQRDANGFVWPFGTYDEHRVEILREEGFAYGRTTKDVDSIVPIDDPLMLHINCHFLNPKFYDIWSNAKMTGYFYFFGHSYEMMDGPLLHKRYEDIISAITRDPEAIWVDVIDLVR